MRIIAPYFTIESKIDSEAMLKKLEMAARTCYKSEDRMTGESAESLLKTLIKIGHHSVIEHEYVTVKFICDRGISHEIVRHRIASYSQESTRYCNYSNDKFGKEITVIKPYFWFEGSTRYAMWKMAMQYAEDAYFALLSEGAKPEEARSVLPNSLKTEIVVTFNIREWRHFFTLRTSKKAHPQMRELARPLLYRFQNLIPVLFDDITYE